MNNLDIFYDDDFENFKSKVKVFKPICNRNLNIISIEIPEAYASYTVDLTKRKFRQLNDYVIFPKTFSEEMYNYIVRHIAVECSETINFVKSRFIYEQFRHIL